MNPSHGKCRWFSVPLLALMAACAAPATQRAESLVRQNRTDEAVVTLQGRLQAHPDDLAARRLLVRVLGFAGDVAAARAQATELAKRLPPGDPDPRIELGHALELSHRYDEALEAYDEAASSAPASPAGPREGGIRCAHWGELAEALPRLEEAVHRGAGDVETLHTLGLVRLHLGDVDGAYDAYREAIVADRSRVDGWLGLASVAVVRGDAAGALQAYDAILVLHPRFAAGQLGRAWALARLGRTSEARRALDIAEQLGAPQTNVQRQRTDLDALGR